MTHLTRSINQVNPLFCNDVNVERNHGNYNNDNKVINFNRNIYLFDSFGNSYTEAHLLVYNPYVVFFMLVKITYICSCLIAHVIVNVTCYSLSMT